MEHPEDPSQRVSHETIYRYIYAHPAGELKKLLVESLRQGHQKRRPRSRGKDRRGGLRNLRSIRERPQEAQAPGRPQPAGFARDHLPVHLCAPGG
ncbi:hypothetical protein BAE28_07170 [Acidithiobacillus caldus]|nr:hypothetical protein BAE28_07170 [Acidithiobacillus caldus]